ncbi:MAG: aminomethyl-transferring glycine dehydrogenase subunit GcvPA [Pseudobdellovibrionaceae bacterium]
MRYLPATAANRKEMLEKIGVKNVDALFKDVPAKALNSKDIALPDHMSELAVERALGAYANQNHAASQGPFFLGAGTYYHHIPATVDYIIQRSEFLTAYTPYQPEIAQGTLQMIFEYQSMIAQLTGMDIANASLYDGATSTTEAALMAMRLTKRTKIVTGAPLHPHYEEVLNTYLKMSGEALGSTQPNDQTAAMIVQYPAFDGSIPDLAAARKICDAAGALLIVVINEIVALGLLPAPREADIVCGEGQSLGLPMSFGGPHLGFFACKEAYLRQMPGRLCGETVDADGKRSFVLTLSTREQHIRREKATSNICTNQGLCALAFTVHLALLGEDGFKALAKINHERACALHDALSKVKGVTIKNKNFFNEFVIDLNGVPAKSVVADLAKEGIIAGLAVGENALLVTATEMTQDEDIARLTQALSRLL